MKTEKIKKNKQKQIMKVEPTTDPDHLRFESLVEEYSSSSEIIFHIRIYRAIFLMCLQHLKTIANFNPYEKDAFHVEAKKLRKIENQGFKIISKESIILAVAHYTVRYSGKKLMKELSKDAWDEAKKEYFENTTLNEISKKILKDKVSKEAYFKEVIYKLVKKNINEGAFIEFIEEDAHRFFITEDDMKQLKEDIYLSLQI